MRPLTNDWLPGSCFQDDLELLSHLNGLISKLIEFIYLRTDNINGEEKARARGV